jgi:hypothetical protein
MNDVEKEFFQETFEDILFDVEEDYQYAKSGAYISDEFLEKFTAKANFLIEMANKGLVDLKRVTH